MAKTISIAGIGDVQVPDSATDAEIDYFVSKVQQADDPSAFSGS